MTAPQFDGFSMRAVEFYRALENDNTKSFWHAHKDVYESEVADPMRLLLAELEPEFGSAKLFRPYRDTRFSADKTPYKTAQGLFVGAISGIGYYAQLSGDGLLIGGGFRSHSQDDVDRYRKAVDADVSGAALAEIVVRLRADGLSIEGEQLKTRPRGYPPDHPRLDLLRFRHLFALHMAGTPDWLSSRRALDEIRRIWRQVMPLASWAAEHVAQQA